MLLQQKENKTVKYRRVLSPLLASLLLLIALPCMLAAAKQVGPHFYFVQITDTHFGDAGNGDRALKVVKDINALPMKIECVVHTGDLFMNNILDRKSVQEEKAVMGQLKLPIHYVPGNHDVVEGSDLEKTASAFLELVGPLSSKAEYNGVVFLMFCSEPWCDSESLAGYDALKWLKKALSETKGKPVIIFTHRPMAQDFYNGSMHDTWSKASEDQFAKLINSYNVKAVITGHYHRAEQHWLGKVPVFVASSVAGYWDRETAYRVYEYDNGRIGFRTQYPK